MKKFTVFLCTALLVFGVATAASATLVEFTFTGDNTITEWYIGGKSQYLGSLTNLGTWETADSVKLDLGSGHYDIMWRVVDDAYWDPADESYIGGFLAQISWAGNTLFSSEAWEIDLDATNGPADWIGAKQYVQNGEWPWNDFGQVPGIDAAAWWIWGPVNYPSLTYRGQFAANVYIRTTIDVSPVPEPATMLLLGCGLIGLGGLGRKKFLKKS